MVRWTGCSSRWGYDQARRADGPGRAPRESGPHKRLAPTGRHRVAQGVSPGAPGAGRGETIPMTPESQGPRPGLTCTAPSGLRPRRRMRRISITLALALGLCGLGSPATAADAPLAAAA